MGEVKGFLRVPRKEFTKEDTKSRIKHYNEFIELMPEKELADQGARCMDCGIPFCQSGCPINNIIPDFNDLVYKGDWYKAIERLHKTNNFPEFTGRVCPAPCENACVLGINEPPVAIKNIELSIIERAYQEGWIKPKPPKQRTGKKVAVIGSGPSGLACADQLNKKGHEVTVFEKNERLGGLLTFGIPDFKLEKRVVERRTQRMEEEGVVFKTGVHVGMDVSTKKLREEFDAIVLCGGAEQARELPIPGADLDGVYQAMRFLPANNRKVYGGDHPEFISAKGKHVVVLGGGDTGSDCVGTSNRHGALSVKQFELMPKPPVERDNDNPWPQWAFIYRTSTSHEEGVERDYCVMTKEFIGDDKGQLKKLRAVRLEFGDKDPVTGRRPMKEIPGSDFEVDCDMVLLALGFTGPVKNGMLDELGVELDQRGNVKADEHKMTSVDGVFTAGDMTRGQSLVVWAIHEGRVAADHIHQYLSVSK